MKAVMHRLERSDTGEDVFQNFTYEEWGEKIYSDGIDRDWCIDVDGVKAYDRGIVRKKSFCTAGNWPMTSVAAGVHPDEVPEMMKKDAAAGCKTEYTPDGDPIFRSRGHRRDYLKVHGMHDRDGGYGD